MCLQRRYNVATTSGRCSDVITTLLRRCVRPGYVSLQKQFTKVVETLGMASIRVLLFESHLKNWRTFVMSGTTAVARPVAIWEVRQKFNQFTPEF